MVDTTQHQAVLTCECCAFPGQHTHTAHGHHHPNYGSTSNHIHSPAPSNLEAGDSSSHSHALTAGVRLVRLLTCIALFVVAIVCFAPAIHFSGTVIERALDLVVAILIDLGWIVVYIARAVALAIVFSVAPVFAGMAVTLVVFLLAVLGVVLLQAGKTVKDAVVAGFSVVKKKVVGVFSRAERAATGEETAQAQV